MSRAENPAPIIWKVVEKSKQKTQRQMCAGGEIPALVAKWNGFGYLGAGFTLGKAQISEKYRQEEKGGSGRLAVFILRRT